MATAAGADPAKVVAATSDAGMTQADAEANALSVNSTPTFAVTKNGKTNVIGSGVPRRGRAPEGAPDEARLGRSSRRPASASRPT